MTGKQATIAAAAAIAAALVWRAAGALGALDEPGTRPGGRR